MESCTAMNRLQSLLKLSFYCDVCHRAYPIRYMDRHNRTRKHKHNLLMLKHVPRIHPSEVKDNLQD